MITAMRERVLIAVIAAAVSAGLSQMTSAVVFGARIEANTAQLVELRQDVRELRRVMLRQAPKGPGS